MATPGQLVQAMADVLGISRATVTVYDRVLAENGFRSKSGRGTSAAKVTSRDAANLLIALAASPLFGLSAKDAVRNCQTFASLTSSPFFQDWSKSFTAFGLPTLANLPRGHSFGEALSALIDAAGEGETFKRPGIRSKRHLTGTDTKFEVRFVGPGPSAQIVAEAAKKSARLIYSDARQFKSSYKGPLWTEVEKMPDLHQISSVGFKTIQTLSSLISGDGGTK